MKQLFLFVSLAVLGFGLYLNLFYDVPDNQIQTNTFVSWFLIIVGISSVLMNFFWGTPRKQKRK